MRTATKITLGFAAGLLYWVPLVALDYVIGLYKIKAAVEKPTENYPKVTTTATGYQGFAPAYTYKGRPGYEESVP